VGSHEGRNQHGLSERGGGEFLGAAENYQFLKRDSPRWNGWLECEDNSKQSFKKVRDNEFLRTIQAQNRNTGPTNSAIWVHTTA
jgi:hypothetical protein